MGKLMKCDFCGRSENEAFLMVTGVKGRICNACIEGVYEILEKEKLEKGIAGKLEIARNLLKNEVSVEIIMQSTGLTKQQVENLTNK